MNTPPSKPVLFIFLLIFTLSSPTCSRQIGPYFQPIPSHISYSPHCSHIIPESTSTKQQQFQQQHSPHFTYQAPTLYAAFVSNGDQILGPSSQITANFIPRNFVKTQNSGVFKIDATLAIRVSSFRFRDRRNLLSVHGGPRIPFVQRIVRFRLSGLWDSSSGQLCMVGLGNKRLNDGKDLEFDVVFKAKFLNSSVIDSSLVTGSLENLGSEGSEGYFKPIYIMGYSRMNYEYTLVKEEDVVKDESGGESSSLSSVGRQFRNCHQITSLADYFELDYRKDCGGRNCSLIDEVVGFLPRFMSLNEIDCTGQRMVRVAFGFSNVSDVRNGYQQPLDPSRTLVAEGAWDGGKTRLSFVACRILNFSDTLVNAAVGDCSVRVDFTLADTLTVRNSSVISGHIWSKKNVGEPGYFDRIEIRASGSRRAALPDMKYEYTEVERAKQLCSEKKVSKQKGKTYPDQYSQDMKFDMDVKNGKGKGAWGKAHPVFIGARFMQDMYPTFRSSVARPNLGVQVNSSNHGFLNITYRITLSPKDEFKVGGTLLTTGEKLLISAEGIYDTDAGRLCMVGCWNRQADGNVPLNTSRLDCDIFINIQFPPRNSNGKDVVKGTIESIREKKSDPLYFERLDLSGTSLTQSQVYNVFWRMDFEITMVLISNTLACVLVGLQLFHVKKHPDVLPFISVVMLVVITLGHMIPLLLNMEALFLSTPSKKTVLFGSGGWLEVNEVLVRVITMVAFLLEFRLLQLTWSARGGDSSQKNALQESEKKVIYYSLPLYAVGALIAWSVQLLRGSPRKPFLVNTNSATSVRFWHSIKSYGGFILDAFLLPQIMFNIFSDSKETSLSVPYYIGTTIVRLLPHAYDLFRAHSSAWSFDPWYIYADPGMNYYSTSWDIIISVLGLVFVILISLQQRFGGKWVVPKRYRKSVAYERVPVGLELTMNDCN